MRPALASLVCLAILHAETLDLRMHSRIRIEATQRSRVMEYAAELIDGIGPRLTGSPNLRKATEWAREKLASLGCADVRSESWGAFGMGWRQRNVWARMTEPDTAVLLAQAAPWSPATKGAVKGEVVPVGINDEKHFAEYRGKLAGKIVLFGSTSRMPPIEKPLFSRSSTKDLDEFAPYRVEGPEAFSTQHYERAFTMLAFREKVGRFFADEKVAAVIVPSANNEQGGASGGTIFVDSNYTFGWWVYRRDHAMTVPLVVMAAEHYGRIARLIGRKVPVNLELLVDTEFTGDNVEEFNTFADIPGVDPNLKDELVMVGAHLDSWHAATGATDDGAGVLIAMEAMRILRALDVQPRRTIRIALWTGEEQGSLGCREWLKRHVADVPLANGVAPDFLRARSGEIKPKPLYERISAMFNLDAGGGRVRGVSLSHNVALVPLFAEWITPLRDLGVSMVSARSDCGGDCWTFEQAGIPTPTLRQDPLDYETRTHHTNFDTYERLQPEDLRQAAIVAATLIYHVAMRDEKLPRIPPQ